MISPKENCLLLYIPAQIAADDFLLHAEQNFGCDFWEVKVKGVFLIFILYSFFRVFPIFDPRVFFGFYPNPSRVYIKKSFQTFTLHLFGDSFDDQRVTGEGW